MSNQFANSCIQLLLNEGYTAFRIQDSCNNVFCFLTRQGKPATAVGFSETGLLNLFTTGSIARDDNFDPFFFPGKFTISVENCTFGAAKLCLEMQAWSQAIENEIDEKAFLNKLKNARSDVLRAFANDFEGGNLWDQLAMKVRLNAETTILKIAEKKMNKVGGAEAAMWRSVMDAAAKRKEYVTNTVNDARSLYDYKQAVLLPLCAKCPPLVAKEGVGREVVFEFIVDNWDRTVEWFVFLVRRWFLQNDPLHLYLFYLLNAFGTAAECSQDDFIWANKYEETCECHFGLPKELGALRGLISPEHGTEAWAGYARAALVNNKKLGKVNMMVAQSFRAAVLSVEDQNVVPPDVKNVINASGWVAWFYENFMRPLGASRCEELFEQPKLDEDLRVALAAVKTPKDAWMQLSEIADSLAAQASR